MKHGNNLGNLTQNVKFEKKFERLDIVMRGRNATVSFRVFELTINHQKYRKIGIIGSELSKCQ